MKLTTKIPTIANLATTTALHANINNEFKNKISKITNLATTTALTTVENTISNVSNLVRKNCETENKITTDHDHDNYITIKEFNNLTSKNVTTKISNTKLSK